MRNAQRTVEQLIQPEGLRMIGKALPGIGVQRVRALIPVGDVAQLGRSLSEEMQGRSDPAAVTRRPQKTAAVSFVNRDKGAVKTTAVNVGALPAAERSD